MSFPWQGLLDRDAWVGGLVSALRCESQDPEQGLLGSGGLGGYQ